jgi:hypothetical protein
MSTCYKNGDFYKYFKENMDALNLSTPQGLFDSSEKAIGNATLMVTATAQLGKNATVTEMAVATTGLEKLIVAGAVYAAGYTGAVIGSIAVASGRSASCGQSIADTLWFIKQNGLQFPHFDLFYKSNPEVIDTNYKCRKKFHIKCQQYNNFWYFFR